MLESGFAAAEMLVMLLVAYLTFTLWGDLYECDYVGKALMCVNTRTHEAYYCTETKGDWKCL